MDAFTHFVHEVANDLASFDEAAADHFRAALRALADRPQKGRTAIVHAVKALEHALPVFAGSPDATFEDWFKVGDGRLLVPDSFRPVLLHLWSFASLESQRTYETEVADFEPELVVGMFGLVIEYLIKLDDP